MRCLFTEIFIYIVELGGPLQRTIFLVVYIIVREDPEISPRVEVHRTDNACVLFNKMLHASSLRLAESLRPSVVYIAGPVRATLCRVIVPLESVVTILIDTLFPFTAVVIDFLVFS
jgi:hypothetical protein